MFSELKVVEAFSSFIEVQDSSAIGLHKLMTNSIQQKGLSRKKIAVNKDMMALQS